MAAPVITGIPRSLFPEGVEVHERHLDWTEESKIVEILRRFMDVVTQGVLSGLTVSINSGDNTLIDILAGDGYTRGSVYAELASGQVGVSLSDYTLNKVNLVTLVASDDDQDPEPHEFDGTVHDTKVVRQAVLNIITETAYTALLPAQKDLRLIVAKVTARGPAVNLVPSDIVNATSFDYILETTQPVLVTGTDIIQVSSNTPTGTGSLLFTFATLDLAWKAPGDGAYGSAVIVSAGGIFTLYNFGSTKFIRVKVVSASLPGSNQTDPITITNFYDQVVDRLSASDEFHRSRVGTGIVSDSNAHGLELGDIGGDPEVVEARGTQPSLDDRLDVSLNEDGTLKPSAVEADIDHDNLKNMPDTGVTPDVAVGDHDARYGDVTYSGGPSVRDVPNVIVKDDESHRDSISRLSGELSGILRNDSSINGDALVGHNFDAAMVGAGWTDAQMRSITNLFAKMFNAQNKPVVGIMYDYSGPQVLVPPQVVNCKGKIRWMDVSWTLDWATYFDTSPVTSQVAKTAYYVYLSPDVAPATTYFPKISFAVPINGYHPTSTDWIFIGAFVTDESSNIIPFVRTGNIVRLKQSIHNHNTINIVNSGNLAGSVTQWGSLSDGSIGVIPYSAVAAILLVRNRTGVNAAAQQANMVTYVGTDAVSNTDYLLSLPNRSYDASQWDYNDCTVEGIIPVTTAILNDKTRPYVAVNGRSFRVLHDVLNTNSSSTFQTIIWRLGWIEDLQFGTFQ